MLEPFRAGLREHLLRVPEAICVTDRSHGGELEVLRLELPERFVMHDPRDGDVVGVARRLARAGRRPVLCAAGCPSVAESFVEACAEPSAGASLCVVDLGPPAPEGFRRRSAAALSLVRVAPGATVIDCGDAVETRTVLAAVGAIGAPLYVRALSGLVPILFETPLQPYRARLLSRGRDLCLVSSSETTWGASEVACGLRAAGVGITHLHVSTLRPLDDPVVTRALAGSCGVLTLEPASSAGLLGSAVAELIARHGLGCRQVSLDDVAALEQAAARLLGRATNVRRPLSLR
jgi:transketolase